MRRIRWTKRARVQLDDIGRHISLYHPIAASRVIERIVSVVSNLSEQPEMGRAGRVAGTRELIVPAFPYIIAYRLRERDVEIIAVFHALRQWPKKL